MPQPDPIAPHSAPISAYMSVHSGKWARNLLPVVPSIHGLLASHEPGIRAILWQEGRRDVCNVQEFKLQRVHGRIHVPERYDGRDIYRIQKAPSKARRDSTGAGGYGQRG